MDTSNLQGRPVLVTGAGSGIGRETALLAARRGADLAICDVNETGLADTESSARDLGRKVIARRGRRRRPRADARVRRRRPRARPGSSTCWSTTRASGWERDCSSTELEDWDWIVSINVMGVVHGCHFFVPPMVRAGPGGHVANSPPSPASTPRPSLVAYTATKFAVLGLSEALREELQPHGIGVTAICPGIINTPITSSSRMRGAAAEPGAQERVVELTAGATTVRTASRRTSSRRSSATAPSRPSPRRPGSPTR